MLVWWAEEINATGLEYLELSQPGKMQHKLPPHGAGPRHAASVRAAHGRAFGFYRSVSRCNERP